MGEVGSVLNCGDRSHCVQTHLLTWEYGHYKFIQSNCSGTAIPSFEVAVAVNARKVTPFGTSLQASTVCDKLP